MPTVEEVMAALVRLQRAATDARESVVTFVTAPDMKHPEGDAWFSIIESCLASAHNHLGATVEGLKDCYFDRALLHIKLASALIFNCRYVAAHCVQSRAPYLPPEYNNFMRDANDTFSQMNGYMIAAVANVANLGPKQGD